MGLRDKAQGNRITVAAEAIAMPDPAHNRIQLSLRSASTHEVDKDGVADDSVYRPANRLWMRRNPVEVRHTVSRS